MNNILILHYAPDNASLCVRIALEEAGIPYSTVLVDRRIKQQQSAAFRKFNPHGLIPALETPHGPMFETAAMLLWLSEQPGGAGLMPSPTDANRTQALSWLFWLSNTLHPALRIVFYPDQHTDTASGAALVAHTQNRILAMLDRLETAAAAAPVWLSTQHISALTCYLCPMLRWLGYYPVNHANWFDLATYPHLHAISAAAELRPATLRATDAEGLGQHPFTKPRRPNPPEGSAL